MSWPPVPTGRARVSSDRPLSESGVEGRARPTRTRRGRGAAGSQTRARHRVQHVLRRTEHRVAGVQHRRPPRSRHRRPHAASSDTCAETPAGRLAGGGRAVRRSRSQLWPTPSGGAGDRPASGRHRPEEQVTVRAAAGPSGGAGRSNFGPTPSGGADCSNFGPTPSGQRLAILALRR